MLNFEYDRKTIENKYHMVDPPFDPYSRMAYHGYEFDEMTGLSDEDIMSGLTALDTELSALPHPIAKARAVKYVLDNTRIDINEHDIFPGFWSVNRLAGEITLKKWWCKLLCDELNETGKLMDKMNESGAVSIWADFDHVIPDWDSILTLGFSGLKKRASRYREWHRKNGTLTPDIDANFEGIDIEYGAILDIIDRLYSLAARQTHKKAKMITEALGHIRNEAPSNTYEAMLVIFIYFIISESFDNYQVRSLGNGLDSTLYSFYKNDIKNGIFTRDEIKELFKYFLFQWSAIGNYWGQPFYMGGTNKDGSSKYNELSFDILDAYDELEIYNPKIQIKVNKNTPDELLFKVFDMIRRGHSCFVFCCEPGYMRAIKSYGANDDEAREFDIRGCYETGVKADEVSTATGYVNALKAIEYAFSNGYDKTLGCDFGLKTGKLEDFTSFEKFYVAVLAQWENLIEMTVKVSLEYERYLGHINPSPMYSATIEKSLKKGVDAYQCGVKFNNSAILNCGMGSFVDSLMAVKELVFDTNTTTLEELAVALENNWQGYTPLRTRAKKSKHKYGNDDPLTDKYAAEMAKFFATRVNGRKNARGGVYKAIMHSAMQFVWQGAKTGASPDGRLAGEEISKNASPVAGMDKNGVTALINSALKMRPYLYPEAFCLDIMLHPSAVRENYGLNVMKSLLFVYLEGGGMALQMNIFNSDMLRDAQKNPEKYRNLQVRVCGWNVLWNNLSPAEQNAYILRAESAV